MCGPGPVRPAPLPPRSGPTPAVDSRPAGISPTLSQTDQRRRSPGHGCLHLVTYAHRRDPSRGSRQVPAPRHPGSDAIPDTAVEAGRTRAPVHAVLRDPLKISVIPWLSLFICCFLVGQAFNTASVRATGSGVTARTGGVEMVVRGLTVGRFRMQPVSSGPPASHRGRELGRCRVRSGTWAQRSPRPRAPTSVNRPGTRWSERQRQDDRDRCDWAQARVPATATASQTQAASRLPDPAGEEDVVVRPSAIRSTDAV